MREPASLSRHQPRLWSRTERATKFDRMQRLLPIISAAHAASSRATDTPIFFGLLNFASNGNAGRKTKKSKHQVTISSSGRQRQRLVPDLRHGWLTIATPHGSIDVQKGKAFSAGGGSGSGSGSPTVRRDGCSAGCQTYCSGRHTSADQSTAR